MTPSHLVDAYIAHADPSHQTQLTQVRDIICTTVPDSIEGMSYGMPAYSWRGKPLFYFAAMRRHLGLYPTSGPITALREELNDFSTSTGCVRVPWNHLLPTAIIVKLLKERIREIKKKL